MGADRPCTGCGYNLIGQPIVRDMAYDLLLVRCPECGAAAALLEYPLLGRWSARWARALAAAWLLAMAAMLLLTVAALTGLASWIGTEMATRAQDTARAMFMAWWQEQEAAKATAAAAAPGGAAVAPAAMGNIWSLPAAEVQTSVASWWSLQGGVDGFAAARGGWVNLISWWGVASALVYAVFLCLILGAVWAILTIGVPRRRLWAVWLLLLLAFSVGFGLFLMQALSAAQSMPPLLASWHFELGRFAIWRLQMPATFAASVPLLAALAVGLAIGRWLLRLLVVVLLPPRLRWGLAFLWTADGLKPPRTG